jgi:Fe-S cluster assembly ATP-binding protein
MQELAEHPAGKREGEVEFMGVLELEHLSLSLDGKRILDNINLDVWGGHIHAIVGPNGAGKTTLASVIMGLKGYQDYEGQIRFDGRDMRGLGVDERARAGMSLAWQEPARFEGLSVEMFLSASRKRGSKQELEEVLHQVGLDPGEYLGRNLDHSLSGGERKKIELASILVMHPKLVLLDEPDSGIDVASLQNIFGALKHFESYGATVLLITHSAAVLHQAEHAFLICCGREVMKGSVEKILPYFEGECIPCDHKNSPTAISEGSAR